MKKTFKLIGGLILALVLVTAAQAAVVTVSCNTTNSPANPILNNSSANLAAGAFVQVIDNTSGSVSAPLATTGLPTANGSVIATGTLSAAGVFTKSGVSIPNGHYVYIVAWQTWNGSGTPTGNYGISTISAAMSGVSFIYKPASFSTINPITPTSPTITQLEKTSNPGTAITSATVNDGISLIGTNYGATQGTSTVTVNGVAATVYYWSATKIDIQVPNTTSGNVVVTVSSVASNAKALTINPLPPTNPTITQLEKTSNPGVAITSAALTDGISIVGTNFGAAQGSSTITINGAAVTTVYYWSAAKIDIQIPSSATSGNVIVTVSGVASNGKSLTITGTPPATLTINTTSLPNDIVGTTYNQALSASGGTTPYTWSVTSGSLPAGLALSTAGVISGTPTTAQTATFTVQVADSASHTATQALTIVIFPVGTLTITTSSNLPGATVGTLYSQSLTAIGGTTPYSWSVTSGSLPAGLTLSTAGVISGTPTTAQTATFMVQVADSASHTASQALAITVSNGSTPTAIVIDDFEGGCVGKWATQADGGYYTIQDGMMTPDNNTITASGPDASAAKNGALGMKVKFSYVANTDPNKDWGDGWGGQLHKVLDLSAMKSVTMNIRWDGSTNAIKFSFQDNLGHVYVANITNSALTALSNSYGKIAIPVGSFVEDTTNTSRTAGAIDWAHITNYNFAYLNKGTTTNYQYIDDITALTTNEVNPTPGGDAPVINAITPLAAPTGTTISVAGLSFGAVQGMSTLNFTNVLTNVVYPASITSWSDTALVARVPQLATVGTYEVTVNKMAVSSGVVTVQQSNQAVFQVTSMSGDQAKVYPNPFDPNHQPPVNIVFNQPAGAANIGVSIYDMTARLVNRQNISTGQTSWDGKDQNGTLVGDGAYLIRIVNEDTKSLIAKGKILVVKH